MKPIEKVLVVLVVVLMFMLLVNTVFVRAEGAFSVFLPVTFRGEQKPTTTPTRVVRGRIETGTDKTERFFPGEGVYGCFITLDSGQKCEPTNDGKCNCYLPSASCSGTVTTGVINPWWQEIPSDVTAWVPVLPTATTIPTATTESTATATVTSTATATATPTCEPQRTGAGKDLRFDTGDEVYGCFIQLDSGQKCEPKDGQCDCYLVSAPGPGSVNTGVICPAPGEVSEEVRNNPWLPF